MDPEGTTAVLTAPTANPLWYVLLLMVLILLNAFFAASELAVISMNEVALRKTEQGQTKKGQYLLKMLGMPTSFLATIQIGVTLSGFLASAVAADTFAEYIVYYGSSLSIPTEVLRIISIIVITALLSLVTLICGELVPKRLAMQNPQKVAFAVATPLWFFCRIFKPVASFLSATTNLFVRLLGGKDDDEKQTITEEELLIMVEESNEDGNIEETQKEMIHNIFEFDDKVLGDMMTHRTDVIAVSKTETLEEIVKTATEHGHSRIPVYENNLDNIIGILYVKDFLAFLNDKKRDEFVLEAFLHEALYVPENMHCDDLFRAFTEKKKHMAIVVDEYGGTAGLVTMEDLLEEIVGDIEDEYDSEEPFVIAHEDGIYELSGETPIDEVEALLDCSLDDEEYNTIGGLLIATLGEIPLKGTTPTLEINDVLFTVIEVTPKQILRLTAQKQKSE